MVTTLDNYSLLTHNTFHIPARCMKWIEYTSPADMYEVSHLIGDNNSMSIGAGSNILFTKDFGGVLIHSRNLDLTMDFLPGGDLMITAGSGITLDDIIVQCCNSGIWGMENLSGIPGEVGASAVQNVGAYGVEIKDVIDSVYCFDLKARRCVTFSKEECDYDYRWSMFKACKGRYIILAVNYLLKKDRGPVLDYSNLKKQFSEICNLTPALVRDTILKIRNDKLPDINKYGSAGSFFKNPVVSMDKFEEIVRNTALKPEQHVPHFLLDNGDVKIPAAWLIEQCGFKGKHFGNVCIWRNQPLVIVNFTGKATADEIIAVETMIKDSVLSRFDIRLEPEVEHV